MTREQLQQVKAVLVVTAGYYGSEYRDDVLQMIVSDLEDLDFEKLMLEFKKIRQDPKILKMPLPAQIRARLNPVISDDEEAKRIAATVIGCVTKYGYVNPDDARKSMGEIGWGVILRLGGWTSFCESLSDFNLTNFQAQIRDLAVVSLKGSQGAMHALSQNNPGSLPWNDDVEKLALSTNKILLDKKA